MLEVVAYKPLPGAADAPPPFAAAASRTRVDGWDALVEALMRAVAEKRADTARGLVAAAPWTVVLDPTARTCLNVGAATYDRVDAGPAAALSAGRFLLCVWAEAFSNSFVLLCYRDGTPVRRLVVVGRAVELADGTPLPGEPADPADLDHPALFDVVRACHLDMSHVRSAGTFTLVNLTAPPRP